VGQDDVRPWDRRRRCPLPQAKGKVERPYRWLQDRIVRTCALEGIAELAQARTVLREELERCNHHQVHSTTKQIPGLRFAMAIAAGNSLFRPFSLPQPYTSAKDIFCLREHRIVNTYRRISLSGHEIQIPAVPLYKQAYVHMVPDLDREVMEVRIWGNHQAVQCVALPLQGFRVHF
jgi:hypothetical protein